MDFSCCDFITKVPDLSGVPNLEVLDVAECLNLMEIHDSVGSLGKLVKLSALGCCELSTLPQALKLRKLTTLYLAECPKLRPFPNIQALENLRFLQIDGTGIEALFPSTIKYLTTLERLRLENGKRLEFVLHTIAQMKSLECLLFLRCPLIGNALSRWDESFEEDCSKSSSSSSFSLSMKSFDLNICYNISELYLDECNLVEEHLALIPKFFPSLQYLSLRKNQFEAVPECFRAFKRLEILTLDDCRKLQEFPNILPYMPKLRKINAMNCGALSSQSVDSLLKNMVKRYQSPVRSVSGALQCLHFSYITLPGRRVPEWFHHRSEGKTISFYACGNYFPRFLVCICFDANKDYGFLPIANLVLSINENEECFQFVHDFAKVGRNHLSTFDPRECHPYYYDAYVTRNWDCARWNHVAVSLYFERTSASGVIKEYGIYFNEEEARIEDICFSLPAGSK